MVLETERNEFTVRHQLLSAIKDIDSELFDLISRILAKIVLPEPKGEMIIRTLHNFALYIDPADNRRIERHIYNYGTYEKGVLTLMEQLLRKGDTFVDFGANIGLMSLHASLLVGSEGNVYAFEANPDTAHILEKNIELNEMSNIETIQKAVGHENGSGRVYLRKQDDRGGATLVNPETGSDHDSEHYDVDIIRPDSYFSSELGSQISLVKMDIEGYELDALNGFGKQLSGPDAPALIIECSKQRSDKNTHDIYNYIHGINDYRVFRLKGSKKRTSKLIEIEDPEQLPDHDNIICLLEKHLHSVDMPAIESGSGFLRIFCDASKF